MADDKYPGIIRQGLAAIAIGLTFVGSLAIITFSGKASEDAKSQSYKIERKLNNLEREMMYIISDKDHNGKIDVLEMYQLGLELKVIKNNEIISELELIKKIKKAPLEEVENYINKYTKKN
jgi:hypothetical protein